MAPLEALRVSLMIFFFTIFFLGLFLNMSILYSMLSSRKLRNKISNFYLISVITASLISCLTSCPYYITSLLADLPEATDETRRRYSPHCNAALFFNYAISGCKILSIMLLSLDRFIAIVWPYLYVERVTKQRAIFSLVYVWLQGIGIVMLAPFKQGWVRYIGVYGAACGFRWAESKYEYILPALGLNILLPTVIIIATNVKVFVVARAHRRSIRKSTVSFNSSGQAYGKFRLVSTLAQAITLMELSDTDTRSNSPRMNLRNSHAQPLGPQKMKATPSEDKLRTEPIKWTRPFGPNTTNGRTGSFTHDTSNAFQMSKYSGEKRVRRDTVFKNARIQPVIAMKYTRTMSPMSVFQTKTERDKMISESKLADREVVLDVRLLNMNCDADERDISDSKEVEAPLHRKDDPENCTVNREEQVRATDIIVDNQRRYEQDTENNSPELHESSVETKGYLNVDTINSWCTIDIEEYSEEKVCVYEFLKTSAGKQVEDIIITIKEIKEGSSSSGDLEKSKNYGAESHRSQFDIDTETIDAREAGDNQTISNDDDKKELSMKDGQGDCENLNTSLSLPVDDQTIEHHTIKKVPYEERFKDGTKTTANENQNFENKDLSNSQRKSAYESRARNLAKTTTEKENQTQRRKNTLHSKLWDTEHPMLEKCPIARFRSRNRIRGESVKRGEIISLHSYNGDETRNLAARYVKNTEHPPPQKSPIERFKSKNRMRSNSIIKDEINSLSSSNGDKLCNLSASRYVKNDEYPTPQKSPIERFKSRNKLSNNTSERDEISSLHSFKGEEFSNLTASKRLKILSDPMAYNRQSKRLLMRHIQPSLLLSTVLLVFFFIITWLPFVLSRVIRLSSKGKIILPEAAIIVTAAVTNLDIVLNPIIILSTRKGLRRTLAKRMSSLFIKSRQAIM